MLVYIKEPCEKCQLLGRYCGEDMAKPELEWKNQQQSVEVPANKGSWCSIM